ncbi:MAG: inositol monophosphatase family protein, partial [Aeromicrobium sp.]
MSDSELAARLAEQAGALLLDLQRTSSLTGKELGKAGDARANVLLIDLLAADRPGDAVLSEESADSPARLSADRVWIIDPLDGTREYGMEGRTDWAVHVALWERSATGSQITAAAVAQPALST